MPANNSGDVSRVDIAAIREAAERGRQNVSGFRSLLDQMEQALNASESFWEGDAAELYRNVFRREMSEMRQAFEAFAAYPNELTEHADRFSNVHSQAQQIASSITQAVWADV